MRNDIKSILEARSWSHYLTRPFTLFGASLWHEWYNSKFTEQIFGKRFPDALFLEEAHNVARCYRPPDQIKMLNSASEKIVFNAKKALSIFQDANELNKQALRILNIRKKNFLH